MIDRDFEAYQIGYLDATDEDGSMWETVLLIEGEYDLWGLYLRDRHL